MDKKIYKVVLIITVIFSLNICFAESDLKNSINLAEVLKSNSSQDEKEKAIYNQHQEIFKEQDFPSAETCKTCHPKQYREWSVSQHAYAELSPVFLAMHSTINNEQSGTLGDFCIRCHTPVGMILKESIYESNLKRHKISQEGVTCVSCHRQNLNYGKISARGSLQAGDLTKPIYGPKGNSILQKVLRDKNKYKVTTDKNASGRQIHKDVIKFFEISDSKFCGTCHDVLLNNGFRLEEAFSEFRHSGANKEGTTCQDCHMGKVPGQNKGYEMGPAAIVGDVKTPNRKITNHYFAGPDYPIIHPGLFPHNADLDSLAKKQDWLKFNVNSNWGKDSFEDKVKDNKKFPKPWDNVDARYDARELLTKQQELLDWAKDQRNQVLKAAYQLGDIVVKDKKNQLTIDIPVKNATNGHNVPTGFIAERLVFLQVTLTDANDKVVYKSGDRDRYGDVRDMHSSLVHSGALPVDKDLFAIQSNFTLLNNRGSERTSVLAINRSQSPLPFVRPAPIATTLTGSPMTARIHRKGIPPLGIRNASYSIKKSTLKDSTPPYKLNVKLIAQMVPVNLIARISEVGFDYNMSSEEVANRVVNEAHILEDKNIQIKFKQK